MTGAAIFRTNHRRVSTPFLENKCHRSVIFMPRVVFLALINWMKSPAGPGAVDVGCGVWNSGVGFHVCWKGYESATPFLKCC